MSKLPSPGLFLPVRIMHTYSVLISAAAMSNMTVLDTADPYDLDMTSSEAIYPISFQVLYCYGLR